jgi:N6-adenine-specific methylase
VGLVLTPIFLHKNSRNVVVVEQQELLANALKHNFARLGLSNVRVIHQDAADFLAKTTEQFDLIYLDPARRGGSGQKLYRLEDCSPNILEIKALTFQKTKKILLKTAPMLDIRQAVQSLENVSEVWALAYQGECREVLYQIDSTLTDGPTSSQGISIHALDLSSDEAFTFTWKEEQAASPTYSPPLKFLYEPNPAIMKAGAFRVFAQRYGLHKLHPNTHLYTSETLQVVPGRRFSVLATARYDRKSVQNLVPTEQANISCRNFPDSPELVRKKLRLADGGDLYLFATTIHPNQKAIVITTK